DGGNDLRSASVANAGDAAKRGGAQTREPLDTAGVLDQTIGQIEHAVPAHAAAEYERQQLVVAKSCGAEALEFLARPIVRCDTFHLYSILHASLVPRWSDVRPRCA